MKNLFKGMGLDINNMDMGGMRNNLKHRMGVASRRQRMLKVLEARRKNKLKTKNNM